MQNYSEKFGPTQAIEKKSKHQQTTIVETLNVFIGLRWVPGNASELAGTSSMRHGKEMLPTATTTHRQADRQWKRVVEKEKEESK